MASSTTFDISFRRLLCSVCSKFSLPPPKYGLTLGSGGQLCSFVDVAVPRCSRFMEVITCWGSPSTDSNETEEDAARVAVETLRKELDFEIRDANYNERRKVEDLYNCVSRKYEDLRNECDMLKKEHDVLKRFYNSLMDEKNRILADWNEVKTHLDSCWSRLNQSGTVPMEAEPSVFAEAHGPTSENRAAMNEPHVSTACSVPPKIMATLESSPETKEDPEAPPGYYRN
uniref:Uncharacterized protein n=1 Tax=Ananas comosus var. bracteatus TaxID=296719 RepID=A0A6V7QI64_ANACO|nr:unnamed protein product [Ananas comosus var. bracteatus]